MSSQPRWPQLDSLRALAALSVFCFHFAFVYGLLLGRALPIVGSDLAPYLRELGDAGVSIFFVLSAFLLYRPFAAARFRRQVPPAIVPYGVRRALRVFPAYWTALLVVALVVGVSGVTGANLAVYLGLLQAYTEDGLSGGISQAWTLTIEVAFYVLIPFWALALRRIPARSRRDFLLSEIGLISIGVAASIAWKLLAIQDLDEGASPFIPALISLPAFFDHFAAGMLLAVLSVAAPGRDAWPRPLARLARVPALCWLIALAALWGMAHAPAEVEGWGGNYLLHRELEVVLAAAILVSAVAAAERSSGAWRALTARPVVWLGTVSYGFYLWHLVVLSQLREWTGHSLGTLPFFVIAFAVTVLLSAASWYLLERHVIGLAHRLTRRPQVMTPDADLRRPGAPDAETG
jgi:peptidoglycan/LPS O-acetylase OafA/YrhL